VIVTAGFVLSVPVGGGVVGGGVVGGGVVGGGVVVPPPPAALIVHVNVCAALLNAPSDVRAVTEYVPAVVPVPEIKPVLEPRDSPGGNPLAVYVTGCPSGSDPCSCNEVACPTVDVRPPGFTSVGA
jgi:hypothetical protein